MVQCRRPEVEQIDAADNAVFVMPTVVVQPNQSASVSGLFGGAQAGYNFETGNFLYGVEGDLNSGYQRQSYFNFAPPANPITVSSKPGWYGDIPPRRLCIW